MREIVRVKAYKKDEKRCKSRNYDLNKVIEVVALLADGQSLPENIMITKCSVTIRIAATAI